MNSNYKRVKLHTLGCKVNQYETEAVAEILKKHGYEIVEDETADVYVINTCTVTNLSDSKSRQIIRKYKRNSPESIMAVMGCYSQVSPEEVEALEEVDIIIGTTERESLVDLIEDVKENRQKLNIVRNISMDREFQEIDIDSIDGMTRAYIKVQDGCNRFCSYCIIPYARGNIRSRDPEQVKNELIRLAENNYKEVVLTGIHIASYGKDLRNYDLIDLIEYISDIEGIERIRLSSVEPGLITEEFLERTKKIPKFCDHFHLSLQSGSASVLKRMNRRYTPEEYLEKVELIRKYYPDAGITTDIIVGFPGETEEEFKETLEFVKAVRFSKIHIFKYSRRKGTPAAEMKDQIPGDIATERSRILAELEEELANEFMNSFIGRDIEVLIEREVNGLYHGHTSNYIEVACKSDSNVENTMQELKIERVDNRIMFGKRRQ